jgi:putative addiction module component (TIGR02574 family)
MISPIPSVSITPEVPMMSQLEYVEAQVMQLTPAERNQLLERLIISLDADPEVEAAWEQVADQREADIEAGRAHWIPGDEAMRQLRARLLP